MQYNDCNAIFNRIEEIDKKIISKFQLIIVKNKNLYHYLIISLDTFQFVLSSYVVGMARALNEVCKNTSLFSP